MRFLCKFPRIFMHFLHNNRKKSIFLYVQSKTNSIECWLQFRKNNIKTKMPLSHFLINLQKKKHYVYDWIRN